MQEVCSSWRIVTALLQSLYRLPIPYSEYLSTEDQSVLLIGHLYNMPVHKWSGMQNVQHQANNNSCMEDDVFKEKFQR